ncbi:ABC transporter substrate-binding protein [Halomarina pelagica]|uniref:ABC transporter substrate-binding protein n=1 Tax=Halomarina pelagica TaxID=2961599 RepID=UPI0020C28C87|nr:ABC transporter substrate-binding protein [Halomarina sp. BND7]
MADDATEHEAPTRREYVKYGGAVVGGGLLAGCTGQGEPESTPTETEDRTTATEQESTETGDSYEVCMSPVGCIEFDSIPETVVTNLWINADTLISFGEGARLTGMRTPETQVVSHYDQLPGVEIDASQLAEFEVSNKEQYYELSPDVFHVDPTILRLWYDGWDESDVREIAENVAPFFGNEGSRTWSESSWPADEGYEFYTLEELTEKLARIYDAEKKAQALINVREKLLADIQSSLPPESERPVVARLLFYDGEIYPYVFNGPGFGRAHQQPMQARDAFSGLEKVYSKSGGTIDLEALLEYDPDVMIFFGGIGYWFDAYEETKSELENDSVGQELTAIKNERFYRGGTFDQGILLNLFQLEMTAKQLYPEQFGEWPGFDEQRVLPKIPEEEQLFDRQRVADIVNGDIRT